MLYFQILVDIYSNMFTSKYIIFVIKHNFLYNVTYSNFVQNFQ